MGIIYHKLWSSLSQNTGFDIRHGRYLELQNINKQNSLSYGCEVKFNIIFSQVVKQS